MGITDEDREEYAQRVIKRMRRTNANRIELYIDTAEMEKYHAERLETVASKARSLSREMLELEAKLQRLDADNSNPAGGPIPEIKANDASVPRIFSRIHSLFLPPELRESASGDREEIFRKDVAKHGRRWAVWVYRWDTFVAMCSWVKKMASFSAIAGLGGAVLKWLGAGG